MGKPGSPQLLIRLATSDDAAGIRDIYAPIVLSTTISFEYEVPSVAEIEKRIDRHLPEYPWLVAEVGGSMAGYAYAGPFAAREAYRWSVEVSVYIEPESHGRGVAIATCTTLLGLLAHQGYRMALAGVALPNEASLALHRALGFEPVGTYEATGWKHGAWRDVTWLQRPLGTDQAMPSAIIPVDELDEATIRRTIAAGQEKYGGRSGTKSR